MRKIPLISTEAGIHSKYWLIVDENVEHIAPFLKQKGYNVSVFPSGTKDEQIHKMINSKRGSKEEIGLTKPFIFITQDWDDFIKFSPRHYSIFALKYKTIPDGEHLANKIQSLLHKCEKYRLVDGSINHITSETKRL